MAEPIRVDSVSRRTVLKGMAGAAGLVSIPAIIAACSSTTASSAPSAAAPSTAASAAASSAPSAAPSVADRLASRRARTYSDAVPKKALQDIVDTFTKADRDHGQDQHGRPQHVPGPDQLRTCRARRTTSSPGSPASGCGSSPTQGLATADRRRVDQGRVELHRRLQGRRRPATTASSTSSRSTTTRGRSSTGRACSPTRATRSPTTLDEFKTLAAKMKTDGLVPIGLRRQGRLARDGHVRHHQPAAERLRLPRRPDGRHAEVDRPEGQAGLRRSGRTCCPSTRTGCRRSDVAGRRRRRSSRRRPGCTPARHVRVEQFAGRRRGRPRRPRLLPVPELSGPSATPRRRSTPRSTGS